MREYNEPATDELAETIAAARLRNLAVFASWSPLPEQAPGWIGLGRAVVATKQERSPKLEPDINEQG